MSSKSSNPIDTKREEFRKYLEREGILQSLTSVLVSLYEEPEKPKDGLLYLKNNFAREAPNASGGGSAPQQNEEELQKLKDQNAALLLKIDELEKQNAQLEKELESIKSSSSKNAPEEVVEKEVAPKEEHLPPPVNSEMEDKEEGSLQKAEEAKMEAEESAPAVSEDKEGDKKSQEEEESMDTSTEESTKTRSEEPPATNNDAEEAKPPLEGEKPAVPAPTT